MSRKWQQAKQWDDEHLTGPLLPLKLVLRLLSSVLFGVGLLVVVALYGALASLPVGLLVNGLTWGVYGLTLVATIAVVTGPAGMLVTRLTRGGERGWRFFFVFATLLVGATVATLGWSQVLWPMLRYEPATGEGFRVLGGFADEFANVTLRRLPAFEMTELEFYSWWPLRVVLVLFVLTMVVSTVRRIAFNIPNLGVLTVHTGIILLGMGSLYYGSMKLEGDVLLLAGPTGANGMPGEGPPQAGFYDRGRVALWVSHGRGWDQRLLDGVPRYNAYNLRAGLDESALEIAEIIRPINDVERTLDLPVPPPVSTIGDVDISYRIVGYAPYAEQRTDWTPAAPPTVERPTPLHFVEFFSDVTPEGELVPSDRPMLRFYFVPSRPRLRLSHLPFVTIEYRQNLDEASWREATAPAPTDARHALAITLPGETTPTVVPVTEGQSFEWGGLAFEVAQLLPEPPFPIITPGYEDASSSVAIVKITSGGDAITRWVYSSFPEISQDLRDGEQLDGRPNREPADESLVRVRYLDLTRMRVVFDDRGDRTRVAIRQPGNIVRTIDDATIGERFEIVRGLGLKRSGSWVHAVETNRPMPVPQADREGEFIGTHDRAMLAVEVSQGDWKRTVWLPYMKYLNIGQADATRVELPDGRGVRLAFARARRALPGFQIRMTDFEMVAYDHRGAPRDYRSTIRVEPSGVNQWFEPYTRKTQLNAPLRAPFVWSDERSLPANVVGFVGSRLDPTQFKFAQAGWDAQGWERTQALADQGLIPGPYAQFTILHVGNNPGIHVIALGGVLMGIGTPWAFYIKPWMLKRRKEKLAAQYKKLEAA